VFNGVPTPTGRQIFNESLPNADGFTCIWAQSGCSCGLIVVAISAPHAAG
jgi:hypothetical protein